MHTEVFNNIDTLIKMADSPLNIDEINTELITLNRNIKNKRIYYFFQKNTKIMKRRIRNYH